MGKWIGRQPRGKIEQERTEITEKDKANSGSSLRFLCHLLFKI